MRLSALLASVPWVGANLIDAAQAFDEDVPSLSLLQLKAIGSVRDVDTTRSDHYHYYYSYYSDLSKLGTAKLDPTKLSWLHIPKTGTSFANTVVTWGCNLEDDDIVDFSYSDSSGAYVGNFMGQHREQCKDGLHICGGHTPLLASPDNCTGWREHKHNFVAMFRQPEQRIISGFNHKCHDAHGDNYSVVEYANVVAGCSVRMMNGHACGGAELVDDDMLAKAIRRVGAFAFVGLTEEWALSVCLFHAMFGSECHRREFVDVRPGGLLDSEGRQIQEAQNIEQTQFPAPSDVSSLDGWTDYYDGVLHAHVTNVFWKNVLKYGVSADTCRETICVDAPDAFYF